MGIGTSLGTSSRHPPPDEARRGPIEDRDRTRARGRPWLRLSRTSCVRPAGELVRAPGPLVCPMQLDRVMKTKTPKRQRGRKAEIETVADEGAVAGAAAGSLAGAPGAVAGGIVGGIAGALVGAALANEAER